MENIVVYKQQAIAALRVLVVLGSIMLCLFLEGYKVHGYRNHCPLDLVLLFENRYCDLRTSIWVHACYASEYIEQ